MFHAGHQDKLGVAETKLLHTLHWMLLEAPQDCNSERFGGTDRGSSWGGSSSAFIHQVENQGSPGQPCQSGPNDEEETSRRKVFQNSMATVELFVFLFAPLVHRIKVSRKGDWVWAGTESRLPMTSPWSVILDFVWFYNQPRNWKFYFLLNWKTLLQNHKSSYVLYSPKSQWFFTRLKITPSILDIMYKVKLIESLNSFTIWTVDLYWIPLIQPQEPLSILLSMEQLFFPSFLRQWYVLKYGEKNCDLPGGPVWCHPLNTFVLPAGTSFLFCLPSWSFKLQFQSHHFHEGSTLPSAMYTWSLTLPYSVAFLTASTFYPIFSHDCVFLLSSLTTQMLTPWKVLSWRLLCREHIGLCLLYFFSLVLITSWVFRFAWLLLPIIPTQTVLVEYRHTACDGHTASWMCGLVCVI